MATTMQPVDVEPATAAEAVPRTPSRGRRRGVIPTNLSKRLAEEARGDLARKFAAEAIARHLEGLPPALLTDVELADLVEFYDDEDYVKGGLELLAQVGYGEAKGRAPRAARAYGQRREERLKGFLGKLPRAVALRLPTSSATHRTGRNDGRDRWGDVKCSETLRSRHVALVAAAGGLWHSRNPVGKPYAETTAGELAQLLTGRRRLGGKDIADVHRNLVELEDLELDVAPPAKTLDGVDPRDYAMPCGPIDRVEYLLAGGRWGTAAEFSEQLAGEDITAAIEADASSPGEHGTIRIYLADWAREAIAQRHAVLIDFRVWAHLRPPGQRIYAFLQGSAKDGFDESIDFYLAEPQRYTFGLGGRLDRAARQVRHALNALRGSDKRYAKPRKWSIVGRHAKTTIPAFLLSADGPTSPTDAALEGKCLASRPVELRGISAADARERARLVRNALQRAQPDPGKGTGMRHIASTLAKRRSGP
jgi:hypothetical protein